MSPARLARTTTLFVAAIALTGCASPFGVTDVTGTPSITTPATASAAFPDNVTTVTCDLATQANPDAIAVLADPEWRVGGWNHVNGVGSFATTKLEVGDYAISAENWLADPTCAGARTLTTVLAKKTYDWDQQHANGIESSFPTEHLTFGEVTNLVLVLRFDPERSYLPGADELSAAYGDLLTPDQLASFDSGQINMELTLFGEGATADQPFMNAGLIIEVDPDQAAQGWVRVQIPRWQLIFYTEENYERTEVTASEWQDLTVQGLRINPETSSGMTVRNYLLDDFDVTAKPELFKEMAVTFALIEVGRS